MTKISVSGASGELGRLITKELLAAGVNPSDITLTTTNRHKLAKEASAGMRVCEANYSDPASLEAAYKGSDAVMIISGVETGKRVQQHQNAINAAENVGASHVVYTSVSGCHPQNRTPSAEEHYATEEILKKSNINYSILRNHMYSEYVTTIFESSLRSGKFYFVGEEGQISPVSRLDIAACAAAILKAPQKHKNVIYEITGSELFSMKQLLTCFEDVYNKQIRYISLSAEEFYAKFDAKGIPRLGDDSKPIPAKFGSKELVENFVAIDKQYHAALTASVKIITGKTPRLIKDCLQQAKAATLAKYNLSD